MHPRAPQHADMFLLYDLILQMDGEAAEGGRDVGEIAGEIINPESLSWLAMQRVGRAEEATGEEYTLRGRVTAMALYLEGFVMGARFHRRRTQVPAGAQEVVRWTLADAEGEEVKGRAAYESFEEAVAAAKAAGPEYAVMRCTYQWQGYDLAWTAGWDEGERRG